MGEKDTKWVKVGVVHLPRHSVQTTSHFTMGDEALAEAVNWGTSLGRKLVHWIHTHPGHEPLLLALECAPPTQLVKHYGQSYWKEAQQWE